MAEFLGFIINDTNDAFIGSIVTLYYPLGDLSKYTQSLSNPDKFHLIKESLDKDTKEYEHEMNELIDLSFQIAEAMDFLNNTLEIIHRDLKGANIFLSKRENDGKLIIKLGDFGHALNKFNNFDKNYFYFGTMGWMVI